MLRISALLLAVLLGTTGYVRINSATSPMVESSFNQIHQPKSTEDDEAQSTAKLFVNGEEIAAGNYVEFHSDHVLLPYTAIMGALGAEIEWVSATEATMVFHKKQYMLNTEKCTLIEVGKESHGTLFMPAPCATLYYEVIENEFLLDDTTMDGAFMFMGEDIEVRVDYTNLIVNVG
jgi:hypothetical protein